MFRVTKTMPTLSEHSKLEFIRVSHPYQSLLVDKTLISKQEIGFTHMRILEGVQTLLQLSGCLARLCKINMKQDQFSLPAHDLV